MKYCLLFVWISSVMSCKQNSLSAYTILKGEKIKNVSIISLKVRKEGTVLQKYNKAPDIDNFVNWFKPSINTDVERGSVKNFNTDGFILIETEVGKTLTIYFQQFNCYFLDHDGESIYERISYRMNHALSELIAEEAVQTEKSEE